MATWIEEVSEQLLSHPSHDFVVETLQCFNAPFPRSEAGARAEQVVAHSLSRFAQVDDDAFEELASGVWQADVDSSIAGLFERRLRSVDRLLEDLGDSDVSRWLKLGLRVRMREIMRAGTWPAIRLRALADFYYSRSVLLMHGIRTLDPNDVQDAASRVSWVQAAEDDGSNAALWEFHYQSDDTWGPQHIRGLRIDLRRYRLATFDLRGDDGGHDALATRLAQLGAVAGSSGGFFLYSEPDIEAPSAQYDPVGMILSGGSITYPPIESRAALLFGDGEVELRRIGLPHVALTWRKMKLDLSEAVHRSMANTGPARLSISLIGAVVHDVGSSLRVPLSGLVLPWHEHYGEPPQPGDRLSWSPPVMQRGQRAQEGLSGGPLLLSKGRPCIDYKAEGFWGSAAPLTFSQDETGDRNLLARLVVGLDDAGYFYIVAVDGRQANHALGLSLGGCAAWMKGLGCTTAANMDGGSSKRLMLGGRVLDAPTTEVAHAPGSETRTRPVYSGLAVIPRD